MRVVQVSPFSVIQRSPPVSLPPPEILSDRFLFCRKAQKKWLPSSIFQRRKPPQTADRPPPSIPREQTVNGCSLSCIFADIHHCCSYTPKNTKTAARAAAEKAIIMFSNSPSADCHRKPASPIGAPRRGDAPLRRFSRDFALQNRFLH